MKAQCRKITVGLNGRQFQPQAIEVTEIGNYVNFDKVVDEEFISELVFCDFQKGGDPYTVIFVPYDAVMKYLIDYVELMSKDAALSMRSGDFETFDMLMKSSVAGAVNAIGRIHDYIAKNKKTPIDTFLLFSKTNF
jgi:hypothetical protein